MRHLTSAYAHTAQAETIRVLLVDDHELIRIGIRSIIKGIPGIESIGEATNGEEALEMIASLHPDIVLLDIHMDGLNGLDALARSKERFPDVKIIMLSMDASEEHVIQALRAGASGYLPKATSFQELATAIWSVARGDEYVSPPISKHLVKYMQRADSDELTPRQKEILRLIALGKSLKEIAHLLGLSTKTIETHRAQLAERLDIRDTAGLVRYAIRTGLVTADA